MRGGCSGGGGKESVAREEEVEEELKLQAVQQNFLKMFLVRPLSVEESQFPRSPPKTLTCDSDMGRFMIGALSSLSDLRTKLPDPQRPFLFLLSHYSGCQDGGAAAAKTERDGG